MTNISSNVEFGWFIPTTGDGAYIGVQPERESTLDYMLQVAKAAEDGGFTFALIPTGGVCTDAWVVGSAIAAHTKILKPLVAMRPGLIGPVLAARMAASLDQISNGRALVNVVTGGSPDDLIATGDPLAHKHDERYDRTLEFLQIVKGVWTNSARASQGESKSRVATYASTERLDYSGKYYQLEGAISYPAPVSHPHPPLYFGGSSPAGKRVAAQVADVYLMWAEPLEWIKEQIHEVETYRHELHGQAGGSRLRYGLRAQVVVRETEEEAWEAARKIISKVSPADLEVAKQRVARTDATNQTRQNELWKQSQSDDFVIGPNLWAGLSAIRGGGAVAFVGTPEQISDRLLEFVDIGISSFVLSGYPHLEEATRFGESVLPLLKEKLARARFHHV
ncbi:LLM class flavin-dependent oxidoreductase [Alicyclobacillus fastidiosus]|uniref:LLM class flavin-dependent oxidoreductase n=1 Tax=Alicyclobacillus fastidiosus TaxID=392011 RepID=A0ABY6ZBT4_9BACL|nr:LLM class flavin-dependent oxidoreductase [Alicyclobacillus fastidiosus]WAH39993.1 LLM class flavin-dependent oxidoreductase [Alicyclobacillus fastidiosus]GMA61285.1 alkanesulfonate monooxygenase [Alicyclobacillus fastidiosus]